MSPSKNPLRYTDVQRILDATITRGELTRVTFPTPAQAAHIAQRLRIFQNLMESIDPQTEYAALLVRYAKGTCELSVQQRSLEASGGTIIDEPEGAAKPISLPLNPLARAAALLREDKA